jgi:hypothetical protein
MFYSEWPLANHWVLYQVQFGTLGWKQERGKHVQTKWQYFCGGQSNMKRCIHNYGCGGGCGQQRCQHTADVIKHM